ncbi:MAG: small multi-drug export protein [bacterium]
MYIVELLRGLPHELAVIIISAIPIIEVRGAVPISLIYFKLPVVTTFFLNLIGSLLPVFPILWFLTYFTEWLRKKNRAFDRFIAWLFARTRARSKVIEEFELLGLILFIGIPLPGTGVWTGTIAAYLLGLRWLPTFFAAAIGTAIAIILVSAASLGIINFIL